MPFDTLPEAEAGARDFAYNPPASLPDDVKSALLAIQADNPSPVDRIVKTGELLYARLDDLTQAGKRLVADLIGYATVASWHGLGADERGMRIIKAARRELGDESPTGSWPDPETDPEPKPEFAAPAEAPPVPPAG